MSQPLDGLACKTTRNAIIQRRLLHCRAVQLAVLILLCGSPAIANADDGVDFNRDIRPILSDKCFRCHGPDEKQREADLRLDRRADAIAAEAIRPGNPQESELIRRVTSLDPDVVMPPPSTEKKISAAELKLLRRWLAQDAPYADHWAFIPPQRPKPPEVKQEAWVRNPIDRFVLARLEREGLTPSATADRVSLMRRLYLDLLGLPPAPAEVDAFLADKRNEAAASLIETLLASEHFGERWGRWWLDAARYADSDGYEKDKQRSVWFYRDWVVRAMNDDKPYDRFIIEQLAGDLLPDAGQAERVATGFLRNSMVNEEGGADPEQFRVEGMFDRMDAIGKAILGVTTQCGQCHSHKYDPLSQAEYYSMFAALNDFHEATIAVYTPEEQKKREEIARRIAALEKRLRDEHEAWRERMNSWAAERLASRANWRTLTPTERPFEGQKFRLLEDSSILSESYAPTRNRATFSLKTNLEGATAFRLDLLTHPQLPLGGPGRSIYGTGALTEFQVMIAPADNPEKKQKLEWKAAWADVNPPHADLTQPYLDRDPQKDKRVTGPIQYAIDGDEKTAWTTDLGPGRRNQHRTAVFLLKEPIALSDEVILSLTMVQLHGGWNSDDNQNNLMGRYRFSVSTDSISEDKLTPAVIEPILAVAPAERSQAQEDALFGFWRTQVEEFAAVNAEIESLWRSHPEGHSQLAVSAMPEPRETFVMYRGDFLSPRDRVSPGTPAFLNPPIESQESARLRFARWLVSRDSPTTARVIVNRIWQEYFGRGIVSTPEDFGSQSAPPSHPELLDWLAVELMENHWSLKHIHRLITQSATYQQSSQITSELIERDRYNTLLARGPRMRVNAETVRDIALSASGLLNPALGGPTVYPPAPEFLFQPPASYGPKNWFTSTGDARYRRSIYVHRYRSVPYPALEVFDAPKGDAACIRRERSNTPLQALVLLNEPQFVECARAMAGRILIECKDASQSETGDRQRLRYAFRLCASREPDAKELGILKKLLGQQRERVAEGQLDAAALSNLSAEQAKEKYACEVSEYACWIVVARALLSMDETITKP